MIKKWIKVPGPGQFRGEGIWVELGLTNFSEEEWEHFKQTGFLPCAESADKPSDTE